MCKLFAPDVAMHTTMECAQLFGAAGCEWNSEITRCLNNTRSFKIMDGTSEVQKIVIGKSILKKMFPDEYKKPNGAKQEG